MTAISMQTNSAAVVVLYNPSVHDMQVIVNSLVPQVSHTVFVDNSDEETSRKNQSTLSKLLNVIGANYTFIANQKNLGIAEAQNIGVNVCQKNGIEYVIFSDQDTEFPKETVKNLISGLIELERSGKKVSAVGPLYANLNDQNPDYYFPLLKDAKIQKLRVLDKPCEVSFVIASGMVTRVETFYQVGMNRSDFFIDWVDIEWCLRSQIKGFRIFGLPNVKINHKLGDKTKQFFGRNIVVHGPFRTYFKIRNAIFMYRLRHFLVSSENSVWFLKYAIREIIFVLLFQSNRLKNVVSIARALLDGVTSDIGNSKNTSEHF